MAKLIAFGSSTIIHNTSYPSVIAERKNRDYVSRAKFVNSNHKIARMIMSYTDYSPGDFVIAEWTSTSRHEFRTNEGWAPSNMATYIQGSGSFEEHYYSQGPGQWEYTGVYSALKEMLLAQTFLKDNNIDYLFTFFPEDVIGSYRLKEPDEFIGALMKLIDWDRTLKFDGVGFKQWCITNNYEFDEAGAHPEPSAHLLAADYILENVTIND
jgi:plastocyanin